MKRRAFLPFLLVVVGAACADSTAPSGARLAPLLEPSMNMATQLIPGEYIVVLNDGADVSEAARVARGRGGEVVAEWATALRGYAVRGGPNLILALRADPAVQYVGASAGVHDAGRWQLGPRPNRPGESAAR